MFSFRYVRSGVFGLLTSVGALSSVPFSTTVSAMAPPEAPPSELSAATTSGTVERSGSAKMAMYATSDEVRLSFSMGDEVVPCYTLNTRKNDSMSTWEVSPGEQPGPFVEQILDRVMPTIFKEFEDSKRLAQLDVYVATAGLQQVESETTGGPVLPTGELSEAIKAKLSSLLGEGAVIRCVEENASRLIDLTVENLFKKGDAYTEDGPVVVMYAGTPSGPAKGDAQEGVELCGASGYSYVLVRGECMDGCGVCPKNRVRLDVVKELGCASPLPCMLTAWLYRGLPVYMLGEKAEILAARWCEAANHSEWDVLTGGDGALQESAVQVSGSDFDLARHEASLARLGELVMLLPLAGQDPKAAEPPPPPPPEPLTSSAPEASSLEQPA